MFKYKRGDILVYKRLDPFDDVYFYVKKLTEDEYTLGLLNTYEQTSYPLKVIENNERISLSLKSMLNEL